MVQLPLIPSVARYRFGTTLDGVQYLFDVRWNGRQGVWHMDILTEDAVAIIVGATLVLGFWVAARSVDAVRPPGLFTLRDTSDNGEDAGFDDMGERVLLYYWSPSELPAV